MTEKVPDIKLSVEDTLYKGVKPLRPSKVVVEHVEEPIDNPAMATLAALRKEGFDIDDLGNGIG